MARPGSGFRDPFERAVADSVARHDLLKPGEGVIVGLSGGVDSVVLLGVLKALGYEVAALHVNYGLRGEASDGDEAHVRALCDAWGVPLQVLKADSEALRAAPNGLQDAARTLRLDALEDEADAQGCTAAVVGSHADDQAETVLLHLFRGTGPRGLAGMLPVRPIQTGSSVRLVRPLLSVSRPEIVAYAERQGWTWREDASNADPSTPRGFVRHLLLPLVAEPFSPEVASRIAGAAERQRGLLQGPGGPSAWLDAHAEGTSVPVAALLGEPDGFVRAVLAEALRVWLPGVPRSSEAVERVAGLLQAPPGRRVEWGGAAVWSEREALRFVPEARLDWQPVSVDVPGETDCPAGHLTIESAPGADFSRDPLEEVVDAPSLKALGPLVLRPWRVGDRIRPLGLDGTKKVSDVLQEAAVPPSERAGAVVLASEDAVVWVIGHRLADAVRATGPDRLRLVWTPRP